MKKLGVWLGTIERTDETLIGTTMGVVKCRTVSRLTEDERWDRRLTLSMRGVPWEPVPGRQSQHIPVEIGQDGQTLDEPAENQFLQKEDVGEDEREPEYNNKTHNLHISQKAISKYGTTEGCPACDVISKRGHLQGRIGCNHSAACRTRIKAEMLKDPEYRRLMHKHDINQQAGDIEMLTEAQINEKRHNVMRVIATLEENIKRIEENLKEQLTQTVFNHIFAKMEVAEVYSPPRVTNMARQMGLRAGWALDLTTQDEDGREWDFNQFEMRNRAVRKVLRDQPLLFIGSPICTQFSQMNNINYRRMEPLEVQRRLEYGRKHLEFSQNCTTSNWKPADIFYMNIQQAQVLGRNDAY